MSHGLVLTLYILALVGLGAVIITLSQFVGPRRHKRLKLTPYECGVPPLASSREQFPIHFYLVAILFVLFDVEAVFLFPWAVVYRSLGVPGLVEMFFFLGVLGAGLWYVWKRGVLDWR